RKKSKLTNRRRNRKSRRQKPQKLKSSRSPKAIEKAAENAEGAVGAAVAGAASGHAKAHSRSRKMRLPSTRLPTKITTRARPRNRDLANRDPALTALHLVKASLTRAVAGDGAAGGVAGATDNAMGMVKLHSIRANPGQSRKCNMRSRKNTFPVLTAHRPIRRRRRSKTTLLHPHRKASPPPQADRSRRADARPFGSRLPSPTKVHRKHRPPLHRRLR